MIPASDPTDNRKSKNFAPNNLLQKDTTMKANNLISFTNLTSNAPSTKTFAYVDSKLDKIANPLQHATPYIGRVLSLPTLSAFRDYLATMTPNMVNTYGLPVQGFGDDEFMIAPAKEVSEVIEDADDEIKHRVLSRTANNFAYAAKQSGILLIDIDDSNSIDTDIANLFKSVPVLGQHQYIRQYSSSSNIFFEGKLIKPATGVHLYFAIDDASQIPAIGKIIFDRLVLSGFGKIKISQNGSMLSRSIVDNSVWQAERLDFAGGANLTTNGLTQDRQPLLENPHAASIIPSAGFQPLSNRERKEVDDIWADLKCGNSDNADLVASQWIDNAVTEIQKSARASFVRSANGKSDLIIQPGFILKTNDGKSFDVSEVTDAIKSDINAAHKKWHGLGICDPETEEKGKAKLYINIGKRSINIHSFKHGGKKYRVVLCPVIERSNNNTDIQKILDVMTASGKFYVIGDSVVRINEKGALDYYRSSDDTTVRQFIHQVSDVFVLYQKKGLDQFTMEFAKFLIDNARSYLPEIERVSNIPGLTDDLKIFGETQGYHAKSKYYFTTNYEIKSGVITTKVQADAAINYLLSPFSEYRFRYPKEARSALLAAIMTMALRPILHTAPGVIAHTPRGGQSSGKSPLATALGAISGYEDDVKSWKAKDENDKATLSHLMNSPHKVLKFDNIPDEIKLYSDALASILTESIYSGRILGSTKEVSVPTNIPVLLSANNYNPSKDLAVRLIELELIPGPKNVDWLPVDKVDRKKFVETVFALVQYCNTNFDIAQTRTTLSAIKFSHWSRVVQSPVKILTGIDPMELSNARGVEADHDDMFEINSILEHAIYQNSGNDITDAPISSFDSSEVLAIALTKKCNKVTFARAFATFAKRVGEPMVYGNFILERTSDRSTGHNVIKYSLKVVANSNSATQTKFSELA